jgi:hypothetical protein
MMKIYSLLKNAPLQVPERRRETRQPAEERCIGSAEARRKVVEVVEDGQAMRYAAAGVPARGVCL